MAKQIRTSRTRTTCYIGVDEAGYGPNLGPLVLASTSFMGPASLRKMNWWDRLHPAIGRAGTKIGLPIDDSKKILGAANGREALVTAVPILLKLSGIEAGNLDNHFETLAPADADRLRDEHWYCPERDVRPASAGNGEWPSSVSDDAAAALRAIGLRLGRPRARVHFPPAFNDHLESASNKARVEIDLIESLLEATLADVPPTCRRVMIAVDRLGGRRYYRSIVEGLACGTLVMTIEENPSLSAYRYQSAGRDVEIHFVVKGDSEHLPIALASMIAKYLRELCMEQFNEFWRRHVPGVRPTAGYPNDARRFLEDVRPHLGRLAIPVNSFWRSR